MKLKGGVGPYEAYDMYATECAFASQSSEASDERNTVVVVST